MILPYKLYDLNSKRMIYPQDASRMGIFLSSEGHPIQYRGGTFVRLQHIDVLHFTGWFDTDKKPVWENDVLDVDVVIDFDGVESLVKGNGTVVWDRVSGGFFVKLEEKGLVKGDMDIENMRIIGTVYDRNG